MIDGIEDGKINCVVDFIKIRKKENHVMRYILENDILKAEIDSFGAELKSVQRKSDGQEYMWCGDKKYWGRTSPVLFPFVGSLKNKQFRHNGKSYPMGQHGFARDMEFTMISQEENEIWFQLTDTKETLEKYPFLFCLQIGYILTANELKVLWKVGNPSDKNMYFSIGAHPAFNCPIHGEADKTGYRLSFKGLTEVHHYGNDNDTGLAWTYEDNILTLDQEQSAITPDFFDRCTYIIDHHQTGEVGIVDPKGNQYITVRFDMPLFAIWSPERKNAPFLCIEPWFGRCDACNFDGTLEQREHGNTLSGGGLFETEYIIIFQ